MRAIFRKKSLLQCPLVKEFDCFDQKLDVLQKEMSKLISFVCHHKEELEIIKKVAEIAKRTAVLSHDSAISTRDTARGTREIFIDEKLPKMRRLIENRRETVACRMAHYESENEEKLEGKDEEQIKSNEKYFAAPSRRKKEEEQ